MASSASVRRLRKELQLLKAKPEDGIVAAPLERNILEWHFVFLGSPDTPYYGGIYHGKLVFPSNFPMKPPSIMMITESGRFVVNRKICMSMSDFHPELWCPTWGVRTILVAMLSFMNSDELTTGGLEATEAQRVRYAQLSLGSVKNDPVVLELFPEMVNLAEENMQHLPTWPPSARLCSDSTATVEASLKDSNSKLDSPGPGAGEEGERRTGELDKSTAAGAAIIP